MRIIGRIASDIGICMYVGGEVVEMPAILVCVCMWLGGIDCLVFGVVGVGRSVL